MEVLSKLFGGSGIVKILRLFLFNPEEPQSARDVAKKTRVDMDTVRNELSMLTKIGFIKKQDFYKETASPTTQRTPHTKKAKKTRRKLISGWILNSEFIHLEELESLLVGSVPSEERDIEQRLRKAGNVKVLIMTGVFIQNLDSRLDILIVGDGLKESFLRKTIKEIEAEIGKEIRYAIFSTQDFTYRLGIYDRFIRDVLDYPHQTVVDRLGIL